MRVKVKLEGDVLSITLTGVSKSEQDRVGRIELDLLRAYGGHRNEAWIWQGDKAIVQWIRGDSDRETLKVVKKVFAGYCIEV